jgi:hypothetical protein
MGIDRSQLFAYFEANMSLVFRGGSTGRGFRQEAKVGQWRLVKGRD